MPTKVIIRNAAPTVLEFANPVLAKDRLSFDLYLEEQLVEGGPYTPMDFTGKTFVSAITKNPEVNQPETETFTATPRAGSPGVVDFELSGDKTLSLGAGDWHFSIRLEVTAIPNSGRTVLWGVIPIRWGAAR